MSVIFYFNSSEGPDHSFYFAYYDYSEFEDPENISGKTFHHCIFNPFFSIEFVLVPFSMYTNANIQLYMRRE